MVGGKLASANFFAVSNRRRAGWLHPEARAAQAPKLDPSRCARSKVSVAKVDDDNSGHSTRLPVGATPGSIQSNFDGVRKTEKSFRPQPLRADGSETERSPYLQAFLGIF